MFSVSIDFPSNSKEDALFHRIDYDYSRADWESFRDHLRYVTWKNIFQIGASAAASEFREWFQVRTDVYIPHLKYHIKPHSSPWFSAASAAAIAHRNHFLCLYQQNKFFESKESSDRLVNLPNVHMLPKQKSLSLPKKIGSRDF